MLLQVYTSLVDHLGLARTQYVLLRKNLYKSKVDEREFKTSVSFWNRWFLVLWFV